MKGKTIYQNKKLIDNSINNFTSAGIGTDSTDHFHLICPDCILVMPISLIRYYAEKKQLYLSAVCESCGKTATRKISIEQTEPIAISAIIKNEVVILHRNIRKTLKIDTKTEDDFSVNP